MTRIKKKGFGLVPLALGFALALGAVTPAIALGPQNVSDTGHNLSTGTILANFFSTDESEVCVFCHTPHNAYVNIPLWNQYSSTMTFTVYSSGTLSYSPQGLPTDSVSRLCLSCHEGTTGLNSLANPASTVGNPTMDDWASFDESPFMLPGVGVYLSDDLTTMHPIGFDYDLAGAGDVEIYDIATPKGLGLKFFKGSFLECPTCHDPHVDSDWNGTANDAGNFPGDEAYRKFLRMPNTSSALCLACHNK